MNKKKWFSISSVATIGLIALGVTAGAQAVPIVSVNPTVTSVTSGDAFSVNIDALDFTDLYAWQFSLFFDPTVLSATGMTEGNFLSAVDTTFIIPGIIDNVAGSITFNANTLLGAISGASGNGTLASFSFNAIGAGASTLSFGDLLFLDSSFGEIVADAVDGRVAVSAVSVPEPGSLSLLGLGLVVLAVFMSRRQRLAV